MICIRNFWNGAGSNKMPIIFTATDLLLQRQVFLISVYKETIYHTGFQHILHTFFLKIFYFLSKNNWLVFYFFVIFNFTI